MKIPGPGEFIRQALIPVSGVKRRITKKTSPSALVRRCSGQAPELQNHYNELKVPRHASKRQIRQAYLRLAVEVHPDKLRARSGQEPTPREVHGATVAFWRITQAFEILSDPVRRQQHDDYLSFSPCVHEEDAPVLRSPLSEAKVLIEGMMVGRVIHPLDHCTEVLLKLRNFLRGRQTTEDDDVGNVDANRRAVDSCIHASKWGYVAAMQWARLSVRTTRTKSLQQAVRWRAALTELKNTAQRRMNTGDCRPLIEDELLNTLSDDPDLNLAFRVSDQEGRFTPTTANWQLALEHHARLSEVAEGKNISTKREKFQQRAKNEVEKDKRKFKSASDELCKKIDSELIRRQEQMVSAQSLAEAMNLTTQGQLAQALQRLQELSPGELRRRCDLLLAPPNSLESSGGWSPVW
ncbi:DNAJA3 [Symbiodinium sp. CCMP2592]|nr:DNAJA3 [Symbiodinium sp. CCMP2592]